MICTSTRVLVGLSIWLVPALIAQGQSTNHRWQDRDDAVSVLEIEGDQTDAIDRNHATNQNQAHDQNHVRAKLILARGAKTEGGFANDRPVPAYAELMPSRVGQLSVDWIAPKTILKNQESQFELVIRNRGPVAVHGIKIEPEIPTNSQLASAIPPADIVNRRAIWQIASLEPQEEFRIQLNLILHATGPAKSDARITYSTSTSTSFDVVEPKLEIRAEGPATSIVGDQLFFHVTVTNPGTGPTENTSLNVRFPDGIDRIAESSTYDIGVLNPGETRSIRVAGNMTGLGDQICDFVVTSDHGLRDETSSKVVGLGAKVDIAIYGPDFRYVNRPADYTLRIANHGTAPAADLDIRSIVPQAFAFIHADQSGSFDAVNKDIKWHIDRLDPGQITEVKFRLQAATPGAIPIIAEGIGARGLHVETRHTTIVEGIAAILLEVVDVDDPVEVGVETFYEIIVTNQGTAFANNVVVTAEVPAEMEIIGSQGPSDGSILGRTIRFNLARLAPRADAIYRVKVKGVQAKDVRIRVQVNADSLDEPVLELESTKVYRD